MSRRIRFVVAPAAALTALCLTAPAVAEPTYSVTCNREANGKATTWSVTWSDSALDRIRVYTEGASLDDPAQVKNFRADTDGMKKGRVAGAHSQLIIYFDLDGVVVNGGARTCS